MFDFLEHYLWYYLVVINIVSFLVFGLDKYLAKKNKKRISEFNLHLFEILGGILSILLAFHIFKHKRNKVKYYSISYTILVIWIFLLWFLY